MEKIFILGNSEITKQLGGTVIDIPILINDYDIHHWVMSLFQTKEIRKIIIEMGNDSILSLRIGYHVRLSLNELKEQSFVPLFFVSAFSLNTIIVETGVWSHIFASKGVYFSTLNQIENIKRELTVIEGIPLNEYKTKFLDVIKIVPDETMGRHSLANIWGAYSMDRAANTNVLYGNTDFEKNRVRLYFKYISALKNIGLFPIKTVGFVNLKPANTIEATNKKILLIDDEADKGWETILRKVFKTVSPENFVVINEKVKNYDGLSIKSRKLIENTPFDLYLIDLRLNGIGEESTLKPNDFSGMKILRKIKSLNPGYQAIIFTASNKVWNLKALLDAGAEGYYMKESPEFGFSREFSEENYLRFQNDVKTCFNRGFLKELYIPFQEILNRVETFSNYAADFKSELKSQFQLFWRMTLTAKSEEQFAYAYITLYSVIEIINNYFVKKANEKWEIAGVGGLLDWAWDEKQLKYVNTNKDEIGNNPPEWQKTAGLYFQKWEQTDSQFIMELYYLILKRNGFVHNDKSILDKSKQGKFLNRDVFSYEGIIKLFNVVKKIIEYL